MLNVLKFWGVRLFENKPAFFHDTQSEYENIIVLRTNELVCRWMLDLKLSEGFDSISFINEATVNWTLEQLLTCIFALEAVSASRMLTGHLVGNNGVS